MVAAPLALGLALAVACHRPATPSPAQTSPLASAAPVRLAPLSAAVEEVVQARGYTYLRIRPEEPTGSDPVWAVAMSADLQRGQRVQVRPFAEQHDFTSKQTGRTFDRLWFVTVRPLPDTTTPAPE